jgi:Major capsid protein Gp23
MSFLLKSGEVGNIGLKQMKLVREQTIQKWDGMGFLDGLEGHNKDNVAQLFENQASFLINEATQTDSAGSFETVVFPIIRRVFSKLLANEIVSVQALNMSIGRIFYFVPKISQRIQTGANTYAHSNPFGYPNPGSGAQDVTTFQTTNLYDAYYDSTSGLDNNQMFDRSKGAYTEFTTNQTSGLRQVSMVTLSAGTSVFTTVGSQNATGCTRYVTLEVSGFSQTGAGKIVGPNGNEMDTEEFLASFQVLNNTGLYACTGTTGGVGAGKGQTLTYAAASPLEFRIVTQKYARQIADYWATVAGSSAQNVCSPNGLMYVEVDLSVPGSVASDTVDGYIGTYLPGTAGETVSLFYAKWRQYTELEMESALGEVSFELDSITISVTERKLRAQWSPEMAQDVSAFHNIDAEAELTAILSEEIAAEIDREILRDLRKAAAWRLRWDWNGWKRFSTGQAPYTQKDWNQTLITAINQISAQIFKSTLRGGANWIVCSAEVSAIFDDLQYFHVSNANPEEDQYNMGIEKIGTLQGRYKVYRDPYFPANKVLIGHKGTSMLDTGYVYAPYVPLQLTPTMYNPFTFAPIKGIMTRYATKVLNNRFYGVITVDGVRTFNVAELR